MWTCVESRDGEFGQVIRKIVFGDIYENEDYARQQIPIPKNIELKMGKSVTFFESATIETAAVVCSSRTHKNMDALDIVSRILNTEPEMENFLAAYKLYKPGVTHFYGKIILAYEFLKSKLDDFRSVTVVPMEPEMLPHSALPCSEIKIEQSEFEHTEIDYGESELMIDEIEPDECKFDASENDQLSMLSADDAARLTEMLVSAQNNTPQDLVLTGSISNLLGQGRPHRTLAPAPSKKSPTSSGSFRKTKSPWNKLNGSKRNKIDKGDSLTSRYRDTLIHKFDKDELILKLNRDEVEFRPYFDEQFCFLRLVVVDRKVSNYIYCVNCKQLLCFFAININSGGKVQVSTFSFAFRQAIFSDQHYQET
ncbi:unnamed protein product [Oikopleura dioica]|uniref:Uncharacterized protein n=2 Tax=Oikopleura dioica TaxID=34765 RepID=E4X6R6_OIKDI|nr:unnamed protein product [Oikopleura dioica]